MGAFRCSFSRLIRVVFAQGATVHFAGDFDVGESPSGIVLGESTASVQFPVDKGEEQGSNLLANLILAAAEEGIYWFEIYRTGISWH